MYQIYVDRFYNGDPTNDVLTGEYHYIGDKSKKVDDWYRYPSQMDVRDFYGGDLQGVLDKMDYLQDLGTVSYTHLDVYKRQGRSLRKDVSCLRGT